MSNTTVTIKITEIDTVPRRVNFCWPKPDTRVPEGQRPKPAIEGYVDCEYSYFSQEELEQQDEQIKDGTLDSFDRFRLLAPVIKGLPVPDGTTAHDWLAKFKYGNQIRIAIQNDYFEFIAEAKRGNSAKRR